MRRILSLLLLIGCSTTKPHPDFLGDCAKQPCGVYIPSGSSGTPTDSGVDSTTSDSGLVDTGVADTGVADAPDDTIQDVILTEAGGEP